eukprot:jgi/Ulvmu1/6972/UM033_0030.1
MTFLESGPDRPPPGDTVSTLGSKEDQKVQLMTMHKAKGLEFRVVILLGLSQFGLTGRRKGDGGDEFAAAEAQRNLLYVAVTRAKDALVLSSRRGLSFSPRNMAAESDFGAPSWLLAHLYKAYQVPVTEEDVFMPMPVMPGRSVSRLRAGKPNKVIVSNRGYPIASGWDKVEQLAQRLMQRESEP